MPTRAGQVVIDISAGTSKFIVDLEAAKGKLREFGSTGVSETKATTAAIKAMEGGFANSNRAAATFITTVLGGGKVMQYAFPVFGLLAFGGVLETTASKVYEFFKNMQEAPAKIRGAFADLNVPLHITNDELKVSNDRLENEIAKLQGKIENAPKLALDEARLAADKLAESLDKDISSINKLMKEENVGFWRKLFGESGIGDIQEYFGGATGQGGFRGRMSAAKGAGEESALLKEGLGQIARWIKEAEQASVPRTITTRSRTGALYQQEIPAEDNRARLEILRGAQRNLSSEQERIGLEQQNASLAGKKTELTPVVAQAKKDQEEINRLNQELVRAKAAFLGVIEGISVEEKGELDRLKQAKELNSSTAALVSMIYDAKRLKAYGDEMTRLDKATKEADLKLSHFVGQTIKEGEENYKKFFEEPLKNLERFDKAMEKASQEYNKLSKQEADQNIAHRVRMVTAGRDSGDTVGALRIQQDMQREEIERRYEEALKVSNITMERTNAIRERAIALQKLEYEMQERIAEVRQKGPKDFLREMQAPAQSVGNIFYESMHSGLDRFSSEFTKLITGQKTSFGKMFSDIGEQMIGSGVKSLAQRGIGKLGEMFGIHLPGGAKRTGNSPSDALYVQPIGGGLGGPSSGVGGIGEIGGGGLFSGSEKGGLIMHMLGAAAPFGGGMASGGAVDPGVAYTIGEQGSETFVPRTAGAIIPHGAFGGSTYNIDARGADLGASSRISRALESVHAASVSTAVQAQSERAKRQPRRSNG